MDKIWLSHEEKKRYMSIFTKLNNHKQLTKDKLSKFITQRTQIPSSKTQIIIQKAFKLSKEQDLIDQVGFFYLMKYVAFIQNGGDENEEITNVQRDLPLPVITESSKSGGSQIRSNNSQIKIKQSLESSKINGEEEEEQKNNDNIDSKQEDIQNQINKQKQIEDNQQKQNKFLSQLLTSDGYQIEADNLQNHKNSDSFPQNGSFLDSNGSHLRNNNQQDIIQEELQDIKKKQDEKNKQISEEEQYEEEEENKQQQDDKQVRLDVQDKNQNKNISFKKEEYQENKQNPYLGEEDQYQQIDLNDNNKIKNNLEEVKLLSTQSAPQQFEKKEIIQNKQRTMTFGANQPQLMNLLNNLEDEQKQQQQQNSILSEKENKDQSINLQQSQQKSSLIVPLPLEQQKSSQYTFGIQSQEIHNNQIEKNTFQKEIGSQSQKIVNQQFVGQNQAQSDLFNEEQEEQKYQSNKNDRDESLFIKPQDFKYNPVQAQVKPEFFFNEKTNNQSQFVDPLTVQNLQNIQNLNNLNQRLSVDSLYEIKDLPISYNNNSKDLALKTEYSQYVQYDKAQQANININDEEEEDKQLIQSVMECKEFSKDAQNQIKNALDIFKSNREDNQQNRQKIKREKQQKRVQITNNRTEQDNFFKQYILFTIETIDDGRKFTVERRYNHFKSLHLYFENSVDYYGIIKPTLPSQNLTSLGSILGANYMDQQTLEQRKIDLENYINLYLQNDILKNDKVLINFLEEKEFQPPKETQFTYIGWIQSMVENVQNTDFYELKEYTEAKVIMTLADFFKQGDNEVDIKEIDEKMQSVNLMGDYVQKIINFLNDDIKYDTEQQIAVDTLEKNFYTEYDQKESNLERQKDSIQETLKKFKSEALNLSIRAKCGVQEKVKVLQEFRFIDNQIESAKVAQQVLKNKIQERFILKKMKLSKSNKVHEQNHNKNDSSEAKRELEKLDERFKQSEHVIKCIQDKLNKELTTFKGITKQRIKDALETFTKTHEESLYNFGMLNNN